MKTTGRSTKERGYYMNDIQKKIYRISKTVALIAKVLCISTIVGMCVPISVLVWHFIAPNTDLTAVMSLGFYSSTGQLLESTGEVIAEMCTIIVSGAFVLYILFIAFRMFKSISISIMPFDQENAKRLKKIGVLLLIYSLVEPIARKGFYRTFAPTVKIQSSLNMVSVVLALFFFVIAVVFDYGAELQRLSDETL